MKLKTLLNSELFSLVLLFAFFLHPATVQGQEIPRHSKINSSGTANEYSSVITGYEGNLAYSYSSGSNLLLWLDDGRGAGVAGDGTVNGTEVRTISAAASSFLSMTKDRYGNLALAYRSSSGGDLMLWLDGGDGVGGIARDGIANGSEIRSIDTLDDVGEYISITQDGSDYLAISYHDLSNSSLKLWLDDGNGAGVAGDGMVNGAEIRVVDNSGIVGITNSIAKSSDGYLAISYYDSTNSSLKMWLDDGLSGGTAGDGIVNGLEIRVIDDSGDVGFSSSIALDNSGRLAISYTDSSNSAVKLWLDDGSGAGLARDGVASGTEIRVIDSSGSVGDTSIGVDGRGNLTIAYYQTTTTELKVWIDDGTSSGTSKDGLANGGEIRSLDSVGDVGAKPSITLDSIGMLAISYFDSTNADVKLARIVRYGRTSIITGNRFGEDTSITKDNDGNLAIAHYAGGQLKLWVDDGRGGGIADDGVANGSENRTIDASVANLGLNTSIAKNASGYLAISYTSITLFDLLLWIDDGAGSGIAGDNVSNGSEVRTIDAGNIQGDATSIILDSNGNLVVSYRDTDTGNIKLWIDDGLGGGVENDGLANGSEIRDIASGSDSSLTLTSEGYIALAFGEPRVYLWVDDGAGSGVAGDKIVNGDEIRLIDNNFRTGGDNSITLKANGQLAISYLDRDALNLKLWVDNGSGMGVAGDRRANGTEVKTMDTIGRNGFASSIIEESGGNLAVSYYTDFVLRYWIDDGVGGGTAGDGFANGAEIRSGAPNGSYGRDTSITLDKRGNIAISYNREGFQFAPDELELLRAVKYVAEINVTGLGSSILNGEASPLALNDTDFGNVIASSGSNTNTFTVFNSGNVALNLGADAVWLSGANAADFTVTSQPATTIAAGSSRTFSITFDPATTGPKVAKVFIRNSDSDESPFSFLIAGNGTEPEVGLTGLGQTIVDGDATPSTTDNTDFGSQRVSSGAVSRTFTVHNTGTALLSLGANAVSISGVNATDFSIASQPATSIAINGSSTFSIQFNPLATGTRNATISLASNDADESPYDFAVTGAGIEPEINISGLGLLIADGDSIPSTADDTSFGSQRITSGTVSKTFTVQNTGNSILTLGANAVSVSGANAGDFTVTSQPSTSLAASGTTSFTVRFDPSAAGLRNATVSLVSDDADENPYDFAIAGSGIEPEINIMGAGTSIVNGDSTPATLDDTDFGGQRVSSGLIAKTYTVQNTGNAVLTLGANAVSVSGADSADFVVSRQAAITVPASGSTTFTIQFDPSATGAKSATVSLVSDDFDENPYSFAVVGSGIEPEIDVRGNGLSISSGDTIPSTMDNTDFGESIESYSTVSRTFLISNTGSTALTLGTNSVILSGDSDFSVASQPSSIVAAGEHTALTVVFSATTTETRSAIVSIANDDADEAPYTFRIQGNGLSGTDTDSDGEPDVVDLDDDDDGVSDIQEEIDGTNPLDSGSELQRFGEEICVEWNGYLNFLSQIFEVRNTSGTAVTVEVILSDNSGLAQGSQSFTLSDDLQRDVLLNSFVGFTENSYGLACAKVVSGPLNSLAGQLSTYRFVPTSYSLALSSSPLPFRNEKQFLIYNTYQPSLSPADQDNFVANWAQIVNGETTEQKGTLRYYNLGGEEIYTSRVTLAPKQRLDLPIHVVGPLMTGLVAWEPQSATAKFGVRENRYYYGATGLGELVAAASLTSKRGSGEKLLASFDTRSRTAALEISNTLDAGIEVSILLRDSSGELIPSQVDILRIVPKATRGVVLNDYLASGAGSVEIQSNSSESLIVNIFEYGRASDDGGLLYANPASPTETLGKILSGSYNSYLQQTCRARIVSSSNIVESALLSMTRYDGTEILEEYPLNVPANGMIELDLCQFETEQSYGELKIEATNSEVLTAEVIRSNTEKTVEFGSAMEP